MSQDKSIGHVRLGESPLQLSRVGLGAWAIGGGGYRFGWGPQDDGDSVRAMHASVEAGVNWIDTAPVYGRGHSEEVIGRFLGECPDGDRPMVFTKCGIVWDPDDPTKSTRTLHPDSIRAECENSLRRLGVACIDLFQFHQPDQVGTPVEDSWAALLRAGGRGQGPGRGSLQLRWRPARELPAGGPARLGPVSDVAHRPRYCRNGPAVGRAARCRGAGLQPDGVGSAHGLLRG